MAFDRTLNRRSHELERRWRTIAHPERVLKV